jgi:hypothetical protein
MPLYFLDVKTKTLNSLARLTPTIVGICKNAFRSGTVYLRMVFNRRRKSTMLFTSEERGELKIHSFSPLRQKKYIQGVAEESA